MSQEQIIDILEKNSDKWFTTDDFTKVLDTTKSSIIANLMKIRLHWGDCVEYGIVSNNRGHWKYRYKIKKTKRRKIR